MLLHDLAYAWRLMLKKPAFSALTSVIMALGIGLSLFLYSFGNTLGYKPLPFVDGKAMVLIETVFNGNYYNGGSVHLHDYGLMKQQLKGLDEVGAYAERSFVLSGQGNARQLNGAKVEPGFFEFTRTAPVLGRTVTAADNKTGAAAVAVISFELWQQLFGGAPDVLQRTVKLDGQLTEIIGVMPKGFYFPRNADLWLPLQQDPALISRADAETVSVMGRLQSGMDLDQLNQQLAQIMAAQAQRSPQTNSQVSAYAETFPMQSVGVDTKPMLQIFNAVAVLILLLACINVGNLLLSRANERAKETAIRAALGAPRARLMMQFMWESILICTTGLVFGLLIAAWGLTIADQVVPGFTDEKPFFWWQFGLDQDTLLMALLAWFLTILCTGVYPAWRAVQTDMNTVLRDGTRGALGKKAGRQARALVISEVALSCIILIPAAVMVWSSYQAARADYGVKLEQILTARMILPQDKYQQAGQSQNFYHQLEQQLISSGQIDAVAIVSRLPGHNAPQESVQIEGVSYASAKDHPYAHSTVMSAGSAKALQIPVLEGRFFDFSDHANSLPVAVVTDSFARQHWPHQSALGKRLKLTESEEGPWLTVIGVVPHLIHGQPFRPQAKTPVVIRPVSQTHLTWLSVALSYQGDVQQTVQLLDQTLLALDPEVAAFLQKTYQDKIRSNTAGVSFAANVFLLLGLVALLLAASGIYAVMANSISQRTQEIGVRRALGATDKNVMQYFLKQGGKQLAWGLGLGLVFSALPLMVISNLLATTAITLYALTIVFAFLISAVVLFATFLPTRQALQLEPNTALRYE